MGARHRVSSIQRIGKFSGGRPSGGANGVGSGLLQEARAKLARLQVKSERPGLTAGAFAFCGVRTRFATRGCVRGGLSGWASGVAWPSAWPTVAEVSPDCLSAHLETSRRSGVSV